MRFVLQVVLSALLCLAAWGRPANAQEEAILSIAYDSASMLDVLAGIGESVGLSLIHSGEVASIDVRGLYIRNQQWDLALDAILSAHGLGWYTTPSGIVVVDFLDNLRARDQLATETRILHINYANADSVARTLERLATPDQGRVVAFAGTNTVIVTDAPSVVARMDTVVASLDRRLPQVAIEARIIFVDRTDLLELGIAYDLGEQTGTLEESSAGSGFGSSGGGIPVSFGGSAISAIANANDRPAAPALQILTSAAFGGFSLSAFIEALQSHQLSDVQATPSIRVVDNARARIQVGERTPIRVLERGAQTQEARVNVEFEDTGVILDVVPHVTNNNQIRLELKAERSGLRLGLSDVGFVFEKQIGETTLLLGDGETAVIGGLTLAETTWSRTGIPGLMNLPLLGPLFRTTRERELKQDLIILVTPHIIPPPPVGR